MEGSSTKHLRIKPFTGKPEDWLEFKRKLIAVLHIEKLRKTLATVRPAADAEGRAAWDINNENIFYQLVLHTEGNAADLVWQFETGTDGKAAWEALLNRYEHSGSLGMAALHAALNDCKMGADEEPDVFFVRYDSIINRLRTLGDSISDKTALSMLLAKVPRIYQSVMPTLRGLKEDDFKLETVKEHLRDHYAQFIRGTRRGKDDGGAKALFTHHHDGGGGGSNKKKGPTNKKANPRHKNLHCHGCGELGHIKPNCPKGRGPSSNSKTPSGSSKQGPLKGPVPGTSFGGACNLCGQSGHKASNCHAAKTALSRFSNDADNTADAESSGDFMALMANSQPCDSRPVSHNTWIVDSGCTSNMTNSRAAFNTFEPGEGRVIVAGGKVLKATGKGTVAGQARNSDGRLISLALSDVLYVPELDANLLSVKSLTRKGARVVFERQEQHAYIEVGTNKLPIRTSGDLYVMDILKPTLGEAQARAAISAELIHRRLGHYNMRDIIRLLVKSDVGLPAIKPTSTQVCDVCSVSKHTRSSFPSTGNLSRDAHRPLDIVHADVTGPIDTVSLGGARYALIFTDAYSRWRIVYVITTRDQVLAKFKEYCLEMNALLHGVKVKRLHSDGAGEFFSAEFKEYCRSQGILQTGSSAHTPEQNGVAERSNRTVMDMARSMRVDAGLTKDFWAIAVDTAVYLINRLPSSAIEGATPYQRLFGRPARLDHIRIFGCRAYVQVYKHERKKLDEKAWRGIMVGYHSFNNRCYRIFDPIRQKTYLSTHVTFDENFFPAREEGNDMPIPERRMVDGQPATNAGDPDDLMPRKEPVVVRRREVDAEIRNDALQSNQNIEGSAEEPVATSVGDTDTDISNGQSWTSPFCQDPECNSKGVHMAHLGIHYAYMSGMDIFGDPTSYADAMKSKEAPQWRQATIEEFQSLLRNGTWVLVIKPKGKKINVVKSKWVFKTKRDQHGNIIKYKARLVAKGFMQIQGIDYFQTYSGVVRFLSIRVILVIVVYEDLELESMDVDTAFLNATLDEDIYLEQPQGFRQWGPNGEELVCKLKKAIYGLKQASRNWFLTINEWLVSDYRMEPTHADSCVYIRRFEGHNQKLIVTVWVDDLIIAGSTKAIINDFKTAISKRFKMKDSGELKYILGMEITRDRSKRTLKISQTAYLKQVLERFGMDQCKPVGNPMEGALRRTTEGKVDHTYMSIVGSLMYASIVSRPDLTFSVQVLSRHFQCCGPEHIAAAMRVLRYLKGTLDKGIIYGGTTESTGLSTTTIKLVGYSDADWGGDLDSRRSTTGYVFTLNHGVVSWGSKLQATVALSSAEAEYMALCSATQEAIHLRQLVKDLGHEQEEPTTIYEDNAGCIALSENPVFHKRSKHIDIKYHFIRERVASNEIKVQYVPTEDQLADLLTKGLSKQRTLKLSNAIMGGPSGL